MSVKVIKKVFINSIKNDPVLKDRLAKLNGCEPSTIAKWLRTEDIMLTTATNLAAIKTHFGLLEVSEIMEEREPEQADAAQGTN